MMEGKNITRLRPNVPLAPVPLPAPGAARDGAEIVRQLRGLSRSSMGGGGGGGGGGGAKLELVKVIELEGELWEPEGIVRLAGAEVGSAAAAAAEGGEKAGETGGGEGQGEGEEGDDGERFWVSAGEYTVPTERFPDGRWIDGTDRSAGAGFAHFVVFDGRGRRVADWVVSREGDLEYHNGGMDYDGRYIWATLSQYRPNSTGTVVRVDPVGVEMERVFKVGDHQGGIVHDVQTGRLITLGWGGRVARRWDLAKGGSVVGEKTGSGGGDGGAVDKGDQVQLGTGEGDGGGIFDEPETTVVNPSHWIDYQDCKSLGHVDGRALMLCSGIATLAPGVEVGGLAIVEAEGMVPVWEVPFMERTGSGLGTGTGAGGGRAQKSVLMTKNPMDVAVVGGRVRLYFAPEEGRSRVFVYEVCEG
ncbi:hypothetical protein CORC01_05355 [Colletotrichum orchidophilum]|uniref:Uncharacterized protein n=1 Tax=Colletotrichum orchidophilum TaxID=1209926 RepID=A0A1G4BD42_9PEZI|nr:uncharacterized protein CORC01_05355 [Colletotrichum orchidophilum]OHE99314.1 hypothetical protein CORC01_05355 [Colletotrichum orchidophilum]